NDMPSMTIDLGDDVTGCFDIFNTFTPTINDEIGDVTYVWNDGTTDFSTDPSITVNPDETTTYTVTVTDACGQTATDSVTVTVPEDIEPVFSITTYYCQDADADPLPLTSDDGIVGVWAPATINTSVMGTFIYTFTPDAGQCALEITLEITIGEEIIPEFNPVASICQGGFLPPNSLPSTSLNGVPGSWSPALNNQVTTTYTFTPAENQCASTATMTI